MRLHEIIQMRKDDIQKMFFLNDHGYAFIPKLVNHKFFYTPYTETGYYKFTVVYCLRITKEEYEEARKFFGYSKQINLFEVVGEYV